MRRHPHRGVVIAGHPTSLRLEPKFWDFLREIAYERQLSLSELINAINRAKSSKARTKNQRIKSGMRAPPTL